MLSPIPPFNIFLSIETKLVYCLRCFTTITILNEFFLEIFIYLYTFKITFPQKTHNM